MSIIARHPFLKLSRIKFKYTKNSLHLTTSGLRRPSPLTCEKQTLLFIVNEWRVNYSFDYYSFE